MQTFLSLDAFESMAKTYNCPRCGKPTFNGDYDHNEKLCNGEKENKERFKKR